MPSGLLMKSTGSAPPLRRLTPEYGKEAAPQAGRDGMHVEMAEAGLDILGGGSDGGGIVEVDWD